MPGRARITRFLCPVLLSLLAAVAVAQEDEDCPKLSGAQQRASLGAIYYRGTPQPPPTHPGEAPPGDLSAGERSFLDATLRTDALRRLALRDSDGDGILDYRIACNGKFLENDTDVDGDGIPNVLDHRPYTRVAESGPAGDADGDGLPDHLDWDARSADAGAAQRRFLERHDVVLVERSGTFPLQRLEMLEDLMKVFVRSPAPGCVPGENPCPTVSRMRSLRTIAVENATAREGDILAEVIGQTATMILYLRDLPASKLNDFVTLAHEFVHHYQFNLDMGCDLPWNSGCTDGDFTDMKRFNIYPAPGFHRLVASLSDWRIRTITASDIRFRKIVAHDEEVHPAAHVEIPGIPDMAQHVLSLSEQHADDMAAFWSELEALHVVGTYSLADPFEWHAEQGAAYLLIGMEAHVRSSGAFTAAELPVLERCFGDVVKSEFNDSFYHRPAIGTPIQGWMARTFPLTPDQWATLAQRYLVPIYEGCRACPPSGCPNDVSRASPASGDPRAAFVIESAARVDRCLSKSGSSLVCQLRIPRR